MRIKTAFLLSALIPACVLAADAKAPKKPTDPHNNITFMDAEKAGIDYAMQGEYEGSKWGAQVIAMGGGNFHAVLEPGGLPGAGWDAKIRYECEGKLEGDKVVLHPATKVAWEEGHIPPPVEIRQGFEAEIAGDILTAKVDNGQTVTLKKTLRHSSTEGAKAPEGAIILYDGSNVDQWNNTEVLPNHFMKQGGETKKAFTDYQLHVEFLLPFKPFARSQGRGNSGVYNQHRYEIQVLDSFGVKGMDNQCGGIYTKNPPAVNMCFPPLTWQTYDVEFKAARYKDGMRVSEAEITVKHNGVLIQDHFKINGPTGGGKKEVPADEIQSGPLYLQEHGNPVWYRNVWIVETK